MRFGYTIAYVSDPAKTIEFFERAFTDDVSAAHAKAIREGAEELHPPAQKPWGQTVSYVRSPEGILIELCTPVG